MGGEIDGQKEPDAGGLLVAGVRLQRPALVHITGEVGVGGCTLTEHPVAGGVALGVGGFGLRQSGGKEDCCDLAAQNIPLKDKARIVQAGELVCNVLIYASAAVLRLREGEVFVDPL